MSLFNRSDSRISARVYQAEVPACPALPPPVPLPPVASGLLDAAPAPYGPDERVFGPPPWSAA
jgi:hypothetical protein